VNDRAVSDVSAETATKQTAGGMIVTVSEERPSWGARRADALGRIAESYLQHGAGALSGGDRQQIVIHVDAETLREGCAGRCELEEGPSLPAETVRRLACDASVVTLLEDAEGEPLNVGRKTRSIPPALRRALNARDRGCRFPGCSNTRYVDAHHVRHTPTRCPTGNNCQSSTRDRASSSTRKPPPRVGVARRWTTDSRSKSSCNTPGVASAFAETH
jgi:uncharacterized protein DUF222